MLEFFALHDLFYFGLIDALISLVYWFIVVYASTRPYEKHPLKMTLNTLLPLFVVGFFLSFFGIPSILAGIIVFVTYLIALRKIQFVPMRTIVHVGLSMLIYFYILFAAASELRIFLILIYGTLLYIHGIIKMQGKQKFDSLKPAPK
jgi:divalent metal cation (Fe/Co/Zn/Cd) transporter